MSEENIEQKDDVSEETKAVEKSEAVESTDNDSDKSQSLDDKGWDAEAKNYIKILREENKSRRLELDETRQELEQLKSKLESKDTELSTFVEKLKNEKINSIVDMKLSTIEDEKKRQKIKKLVMSEAEYEFDDELNLSSNFDEVINENLELFRVDASDKKKKAVYNTTRPSGQKETEKAPSNWKEAFDKKLREKLN